MQTTIHLSPEQFTSRETLLAEGGELAASSFRIPSGVCAVRLRNNLGELILLPYQALGAARAAPKPASRPGP